ncbi:jg17941 [Pararge aegeria aegeria]|uniref:Jg17941 protein n=1 Tax=Pararge aegeria aegeria TaxID=348720 RepID=A0A8S4RCW5_9NEOP|nr:jg17941 [Pararge aegeria aegeria]
MHHLENFSIRCGACGADAGAAPRRVGGASIDYSGLSVPRIAASLSLARGWRPPRHYRPRGHLGTATSSGFSFKQGSQAISLIYYGEKVGSRT